MKFRRTHFSMAAGVILAAAACTTAAVTTTDGGTPSGDDAGNGNGDSGSTLVVDGATDSAPTAIDGGNDGAIGVCLGALGDASACAVTVDGGSYEAGAGSCLTAEVCNGVGNVTVGVAASIIACASADTTVDAGCVDLSSCVLTALGTACADPAASSACSAIVSACGPDSGVAIADGGIAVTQASCEQYLAGLTDSARDGFSACMTQGSCNLVSCATGLF